MNIDRIVLAFAGSVVTISLALAYFFSSWWLLLTLFVGLNLLQSAFTQWCPLVWILRRAGVPACGVATSRKRAGELEA